MIRQLGVDYLGLNSLFSSILQVLNLAELGFGSAIVYNMYKPIAENDKKTISALLKLYKDVYKVIGIVILAIGIIIIPFIPELIEGEYPRGINIYLLFFIYLINTVISYWLFAYKTSLLNAFQRADIISNIGSITKLILNVSQIVILYTIRDYYAYLLMMPICTVLNNLISAYIVKKEFPEYSCDGILDKNVKDNIKQNVLGLIINKVCSTSRNSFDSIFISAFLGLTASAIYSNYFYIISAVTALMSVILTSMFAGVGNSIACNDVDKNYNDMKKFNFLYMWLSGWCTIAIICLIQPFMKLWTGEALMFDFSVVIMLCLYFYVLKMGDIRWVYSDAAGLWWQSRYRAVAEAVANIVLNYVLVKIFGIKGIILATLISMLIINFILGSQIVFKHYFKNGKIGEYFGLHAVYAVVTTLIGSVTYWVCGFVNLGDGILEFIIKIIICCILPNLLYLIIYYKSKLYETSVPWILKVLHLERVLKIFIPNSIKSKSWQKDD